MNPLSRSLCWAALAVTLILSPGCTSLSPEQQREVAGLAVDVASRILGAPATPRPAFRVTPPALRLDTLYHRGEVIEGPKVITQLEGN